MEDVNALDAYDDEIAYDADIPLDAYEAVPNNEEVMSPLTFILPVSVIEPVTSIDPLTSNVSALRSNMTLPVLLLLKLIDPVKIRDPDITTAWFNVETNDAVLASEAVAAYEALIAFCTKLAVDACIAQLAVPNTLPVKFVNLFENELLSDTKFVTLAENDPLSVTRSVTLLENEPLSVTKFVRRVATDPESAYVVAKLAVPVRLPLIDPVILSDPLISTLPVNCCVSVTRLPNLLLPLLKITELVINCTVKLTMLALLAVNSPTVILLEFVNAVPPPLLN